MFKKTLIAVALAGLSANALAVNVSSGLNSANAVEHSIEAVKSATSFTVNEGTATATMRAEYKVDDLITLTFSQPFAAGFSAPVNILTTNITGAAPVRTTITLGKLSQTANTVTYRVTDISVTGGVATTVGAVVAIPEVTFDADAVRASKSVTVKYSATLSNGTTPLDQASSGDSDNALLLKLSQQYTASVSQQFDGIVDVTEDRKQFTDGTTDAVKLTLGKATIKDVSVPATSVVYTVKGDFSFLDTNPASAGVQAPVGAVVVAPMVIPGGGLPGTVVDVQADKIIITQPAAVAVGTTVLTLDNAVAKSVMSAQTFTADAVVNYTDAGTDLAALPATGAKVQADTTSALDAGAWTLNGASVDVPYMPYGSGIEQFLWVTNKGNQAGDIKVTAFDQTGKAYGPFNLGSSAKGLKKLDAALKTALVAAGLNEANSPRVALNVTVNAPAKDITVYAAYKAVAADDRLTVPTVSLNKDF